MNRIIAHLDMDAFFASVEERANPKLRGKPIVVGSDPKQGYGRGVVSTANYKAREYGIHSAMPITMAWQASEAARREGKEPAVFLPVDFQLYEKVSEGVEGIIKKYVEVVEQASVDEFYLDMSFCETMEKAMKIAQRIKEETLEQEKVTCSVGIAPSKLVAKIAAGRQKPNGLTIVRQEEVGIFLDPLPAKELPGVGPKTAGLLLQKGITTIKDLKQLSQETLKEMLGKWGLDLYEKARGIDESPMVEYREIKSIGEQNTFERDTFDILFLSAELETYCHRVFARFLKSGFTSCKTIAITVRFSDFTTISSAKSVKPFFGAGDQKRMQFEALKLLLPFLDRRKNPKLQKIRLLGVRMENFLK